jgi:SAM-dependent methyltransferase
MDKISLLEQVSRFKWYHRIELAPGVITPGVELFDAICDFIKANTDPIDYKGKTVLDVGARDLLHSLRAKSKGAKKIVAIDNDVSQGARELILPLLDPDRIIEQRHQNLYTVKGEQFDIVQFFGVLYHLRYPMLGIKTLVDATKTGGVLLIESGVLVDPNLASHEFLYCPASERSPYDPSSVTFFNACALDSLLASMGCTRKAPVSYWENSGMIRRGFFIYEKTSSPSHGYWELDGFHTYHTRLAHANSDWKPDSTA